MISEEKKQRFSDLLKYIRGLDGVKKFATRLEIKLPTYSAWETARAFPSDEMWEMLLPKLCELSAFTPDSIDRYLRGDYELTDLIEGLERGNLQPRARPIMTIAKFKSWLQTLSLIELIQVLKDVAERAAELALQPPGLSKSPDLLIPDLERKKQESNADKLKNVPVDPMDEKAALNSVFYLVANLSLEKMVQVDNRLRDLIFFKIQQIGLLDMKKYQNNPLYILMEEYRITNSFSYEQFEEQLLREGREAGLEPQRVAKIVRGQILPNERELLWIGVFIKKPDGSLYNHDELIALRDGTFSREPQDLEGVNPNETPPNHFLTEKNNLPKIR